MSITILKEMNDHMFGHEILFWLEDNVDEDMCVISYPLVLFARDEDAMAFRLKFGGKILTLVPTYG